MNLVFAAALKQGHGNTRSEAIDRRVTTEFVSTVDDMMSDLWRGDVPFQMDALFDVDLV